MERTSNQPVFINSCLLANAASCSTLFPFTIEGKALSALSAPSVKVSWCEAFRYEPADKRQGQQAGQEATALLCGEGL